ncbi:MAG: hypothetical protein ACR2QQ_04900, partial [Gammaproteobacteria bacterium]
MRHAQLMQVEERKNSTKPDLDDGEFLDDEAVLEILEPAYDPNIHSDAISGIGYVLVIGASLC